MCFVVRSLRFDTPTERLSPIFQCAGWLTRLRRAKADQVLIENFQQGIDEVSSYPMGQSWVNLYSADLDACIQRILRDSVRKWGLRIVALRDREVEADHIYETGLARCASVVPSRIQLDRRFAVTQMYPR